MKYVDYTTDQVRNLLWAMVQDKRTPQIKARFRTQAALARAIGVSLPFVNDILNAKREPAGKVLEFLGVERVVTYRKQVGKRTKERAMPANAVAYYADADGDLEGYDGA